MGESKPQSLQPAPDNGPRKPFCSEYHNGQVSSQEFHARNPNLATLGAPILSCVHKSIPDIFMDCHMMVAQPEKVSREQNSRMLSKRMAMSTVGKRYRGCRRFLVLLPHRSNMYGIHE
jgi:hypothetical protein